MNHGLTNTTRLYQTSLILAMSLLVGGCEAIANIFQAGMWVGVIGVLLIVALVVWVMGRAKS